eukprot:7335750-Prorocentrum_lima.AAC.1
MEDLFILVPRNKVDPAFQAVTWEWAGLGLSVNRAKTKVWLNHADPLTYRPTIGWAIATQSSKCWALTSAQCAARP